MSEGLPGVMNEEDNKVDYIATKCAAINELGSCGENLRVMIEE